jgi:hypothetical protein
MEVIFTGLGPQAQIVDMTFPPSPAVIAQQKAPIPMETMSVGGEHDLVLTTDSLQTYVEAEPEISYNFPQSLGKVSLGPFKEGFRLRVVVGVTDMFLQEIVAVVIILYIWVT